VSSHVKDKRERFFSALPVFGSIGAWTQNLTPVRQALYHLSNSPNSSHPFFMREPSWPKHFQKSPPLNIIALRINFSVNFGGTQTFKHITANHLQLEIQLRHPWYSNVLFGLPLVGPHIALVYWHTLYPPLWPPSWCLDPRQNVEHNVSNPLSAPCTHQGIYLPRDSSLHEQTSGKHY
jgi:hypothetical protein